MKFRPESESFRSLSSGAQGREFFDKQMVHCCREADEDESLNKAKLLGS